uniref:Uncharacterized protein n=1 Tax=Salix viminalis TaxID=40686 RepID=A0A6N2K037_SALVM
MNPPVIPDSLTTLSQYLSHIRREFDALGRGRENNAQADAALRTEQIDSNSMSLSGTGQERLPTPASLAEVIRSSRQLLTEQVAECLLQLSIQLENQADITDSALRHTTQSSALRTGVQLHNLGALLLELGRTIMTLRLGQAPSEAVVNAGPAIFINQSGPNPLMVQGLALVPCLWDPCSLDLVWLIVLVLVLGFFQGELIYKYEEVHQLLLPTIIARTVVRHSRLLG